MVRSSIRKLLTINTFIGGIVVFLLDAIQQFIIHSLEGRGFSWLSNPGNVNMFLIFTLINTAFSLIFYVLLLRKKVDFVAAAILAAFMGMLVFMSLLYLSAILSKI